MIKLVLALAVLAIGVIAADARTKVRIYKQSPPAPAYQPAVSVPLVAVPVVAGAFDLIRRTSCDPNIAKSTGPGDPGFDPKGPKTGNFLIPAIYRSQCQAQPKGRR